MINIIGGIKKRTKLKVPHGNVRPTSSIKKEAIFSIIESNALKNKLNIYYNKCFLDIFAGTGNLGLEAISRGAKFCYFFENNKKVIKILKENCEKIANKDNFLIVDQDATRSYFAEVDFPVSVIFIDPPYKINPFFSLLNKILDANLVSKETLIVLESDQSLKIEIPLPLNIKESRQYGKTKILFLSL